MALTLGTNCGFVTVSPTGDPSATQETVARMSCITKHTVPTGYNKITEVGWWVNTNTAGGTNFEVALYADSSGTPGNRLYYDDTQSYSGTGWKSNSTLDWDVTAGTTYWIAVLPDYGTTSTGITSDISASGGQGYQQKFSTSALPTSWSSPWKTDADGMMACYALVTSVSNGPTPKVSIAGSWKNVSLSKISIAGSWKDITTMKVSIAGSWKTIL